MSNLSYSLSIYNGPKDFDIFSPVFCVAITCQCCLRKSCKWPNGYLQCVLYEALLKVRSGEPLKITHKR